MWNAQFCEPWSRIERVISTVHGVFDYVDVTYYDIHFIGL